MDGIDSLEDDTIEKEDEEMEDEKMEFSDILGCMLRLNVPFKNLESNNKLASQPSNDVRNHLKD